METRQAREARREQAEHKQPQQHVHVHVWKLDCQGMELPALRGAKTLLLAQRVDGRVHQSRPMPLTNAVTCHHDLSDFGVGGV